MHETEEDFASMTPSALASFIARTEAKIKYMEGLVADASEFLAKTRKGDGTEIYDGIAVVTATTSPTFTASLAKKNLTPEQLAGISEPAPRAALARTVLGEDSAEYRKCLSPAKTSVTARRATDADYAKAAQENRQDHVPSVLTDELEEIFSGVPPF